MKILLLGCKGQVGSAILKHAPESWEITPWSRTDVDFADTNALRAKINDYGRAMSGVVGPPDYIINTAAYTKVDLAESNPVEAAKLNTDLPKLLAEVAKKWGSKLIHYSTDYVYDGLGESPRREDDLTDPQNIYGKTKLMGDQAVEKSGCQYLIFRTSWVYAATGKNFVLTMLQHARQKPVLRVVSDQIGSPTSADDIAQMTIQAVSEAEQIVNSANGQFPSGVYHLANNGFTSWHGFTEAILKVAKQEGLAIATTKVEPIATKDYPTPAKRPLNSRLDTSRLQETFRVTPRPWQDALKDVIRAITKNQ